jgi:hypothetical protein
MNHKVTDIADAVWFREHGAVRPMAPADSNTILVIGTWRNGHYPLEYEKRRGRIQGSTWPIVWNETWRILGVETKEPLSVLEAERVLAAIESHRAHAKR